MQQLLCRGRQIADFALSWFVIILFAALTIDVLWGVATRYVYDEGQAAWTEELATTLMVWVSLLGAALVYGEKGHLGVDYFVSKLDPAAQRVAELATHLLVAAFAAVVMGYGGWVLVDRTLDAGQVLPALGWKKGYVYSVVPVSGICLLFYAVEGVFQACPRGVERRESEVERRKMADDHQPLPVDG